MIKKISALLTIVSLMIVPAFAQLPPEEMQKGIPPEEPVLNYGSQLLRLAPITAMDIGVGLGLSYEKILGQSQKVGLILPITLILQDKKDYNNYAADYNKSHFNSFVYFSPGIKFYPLGQSRLTYAVGPTLMLAYGGGNEWQYRSDLQGNVFLEDVKFTRVRLGVLLNNYVNFQISRSFHVGLEGGLGLRLYDKETVNGSQFYAGNGQFFNGMDITGQCSLSLGFRF